MDPRLRPGDRRRPRRPAGRRRLEKIKPLFEDAFGRAWNGEIENDDFNRLVLRAGLAARDVTILRAYAKYLRQVGSTFSNAYIERALTAIPISRDAGLAVRGPLRSGPGRAGRYSR
jgi:NAD-specific glutamate dehydrogenase